MRRSGPKTGVLGHPELHETCDRMAAVLLVIVLGLVLAERGLRTRLEDRVRAIDGPWARVPLLGNLHSLGQH